MSTGSNRSSSGLCGAVAVVAAMVLQAPGAHADTGRQSLGARMQALQQAPNSPQATPGYPGRPGPSGNPSTMTGADRSGSTEDQTNGRRPKAGRSLLPSL